MRSYIQFVWGKLGRQDMPGCLVAPRGGWFNDNTLFYGVLIGHRKFIGITKQLVSSGPGPFGYGDQALREKLQEERAEQLRKELTSKEPRP